MVGSDTFFYNLRGSGTAIEYRKKSRLGAPRTTQRGAQQPELSAVHGSRSRPSSRTPAVHSLGHAD